MGRTASGVRGITLEGDNKVVGVVSSMDGNKIFSLSTLGLGKISKGEDYRITNRGSKGVITMKVGEENGSLLTIKTVRGDENIIIITSKGTTIKTSLSQLREMGRNTRGVKMITMRENESISSCCIEPSQEDYEAQEEVIKEDVSESEDEKILSEMIKNSSLEDGE